MAFAPADWISEAETDDPTENDEAYECYNDQ